jgi:4-amino-4-deoxy-L-arabinose transferase-like glycosyltransferase
MAYSGEQKRTTWLSGFHISDRAYFLGSALLFAVVIFGLVFITSTLMSSEWTTYDMQRFYAMAQVIVDGATPYLDYQDPKPPLIFFTLAIPTLLGNKILGGLLLVGAANFISALLLMAMGWRLYGRFSGMLAGLLFSLNIAWAQGYFVLTEPFALTFILLSTYVMAFTGLRWKYLLAGVFAGVGIGFKQYALLLVPLLLFYMFRSRELKKVPELLAGILIPLVIIFGAIFLVYGPGAGSAALYWSFGVADTYITETNMGDVTSYRATDPLILAANIVLAVTMFTSLLLFALANIIRDRPTRPLDEYFILAALLFSGTILIRQYLHYWILALPFIVLLCARQFRTTSPEVSSH